MSDKSDNKLKQFACNLRIALVSSSKTLFTVILLILAVLVGADVYSHQVLYLDCKEADEHKNQCESIPGGVARVLWDEEVDNRKPVKTLTKRTISKFNNISQHLNDIELKIGMSIATKEADDGKPGSSRYLPGMKSGKTQPIGKNSQSLVKNAPVELYKELLSSFEFRLNNLNLNLHKAPLYIDSYIIKIQNIRQKIGKIRTAVYNNRGASTKEVKSVNELINFLDSLEQKLINYKQKLSLLRYSYRLTWFFYGSVLLFLLAIASVFFLWTLMLLVTTGCEWSGRMKESACYAMIVVFLIVCAILATIIFLIFYPNFLVIPALKHMAEGAYPSSELDFFKFPLLKGLRQDYSYFDYKYFFGAAYWHFLCALLAGVILVFSVIFDLIALLFLTQEEKVKDAASRLMKLERLNLLNANLNWALYLGAFILLAFVLYSKVIYSWASAGLPTDIQGLTNEYANTKFFVDAGFLSISLATVYIPAAYVFQNTINSLVESMPKSEQVKAEKILKSKGLDPSSLVQRLVQLLAILSPFLTGAGSELFQSITKLSGN